MKEPKTEQTFENDYSKYGFHDKEESVFKTEKGISVKVVEQISKIKKEPEWMLKLRLKSLEEFWKRPMPQWGANLNVINFNEIYYYLRPTDRQGDSWEDVPEYIKNTFNKLGIPEAEQKFLGGVGAQYESEVVYHKIREDLEKQGVVFLDMDGGLREHSDIVKKYFCSVIPHNDNKFAALNTAVWSGGSFVYIPAGVKVDLPLQAYFRINARNMGQFERTLIIAEPESSVHYIEGCTAPTYSSDSLHSAVVELIAMEGSRIQYTTIQNWSNNVYNLVTKRAFAHKNSTVFWVDGNLGCLTSDTNIFLNSNIKKIADIESGDTVFSVDENFDLKRQKVIAKKYSGKQKVYKMRTLNHREIKATGNHPFMILKKKSRNLFVRWTPLSDIEDGDLVAISGEIPDCGEPYKLSLNSFNKTGIKKIKIPAETTEDLMWLLGVYIGDGYCDNGRVYFAVPEADKACAKLVEVLKNIFDLEGSRMGVALRIASVDFIRFIKGLGFGGNSRTKRVPKWIFTLPKSQRIAFIDGYIAADGNYRKNHKNISITSNNRALLEDTKYLAMTCSLNPAKISTWTRLEKKPLGKIEKEYTHHFLYFGEGKLEKPISFVPVSDISYCGEEDTWDIEVEGAHNFVANGFIVHNSKITMKYPSVYLLGERAKAEILSVAFAGKGQHQDAGGKIMHLAPNTTSRITSKSVSKDGGRTTYRGLIHVAEGCKNVKSHVACDALILDENSASDTVPYMEINEKNVNIEHEATVGKIGEEQLFYLMSRGLSEDQAKTMIVSGFMEPFTKELPLEYAIELNRLIAMNMEGSVG